MTRVDVWREQRTLSATLGAWGLASVVVGESIRRSGARTGSDFGVGFGRQQSGWGAIDAAIAAFGAVRSRQRRATVADADDPVLQATELASLNRILRINTGLDVLYLVGGAALVAGADRVAARSRRSTPELARGDGWGIVVQGGFLLVLDAVFARRTRA